MVINEHNLFSHGKLISSQGRIPVMITTANYSHSASNYVLLY